MTSHSIDKYLQRYHLPNLVNCIENVFTAFSCILNPDHPANMTMKSIFPVTRYARCYSRYEDQYSDVSGQPLYMLMSSMQASQMAMSQATASLANIGTWSAISASNLFKIALEMQIISEDSCVVQVIAESTESKTEILLVLIKMITLLNVRKK